jgi:DMSO/TMAO reductase YedYZ heme-binding membrane subunit
MFGVAKDSLKRLRLFVQVILCLIMSGFDAVATVRHITLGIATELNPAMDYFINKDFVLFFFIKILITATGLMICYRLSQHFLARRALGVLTFIYTILTGYHYLIYKLY